MKNQKILKVLLTVGITVFIVGCVVGALYGYGFTDSWLFWVLAFIGVIPLYTAGFIYSANIKETNPKKSKIIKTIVIVHLLGVIAVAIKYLL